MLWVLLLSLCGLPVQANDAVVRFKSHGASGTIIETRPGYSLILGCAHAYEGASRAKVIKIDGPPTPNATKQRCTYVRLVAVDYELDLSLVELDNGPLGVCPIAERPASGPCLSCGYDEMKWPMTRKPATVIGTSGTTTYTREIPWHGRSGGALIDSAGYLIGVVQGYETSGSRRGMYVSHSGIVGFVARSRVQRMPPALTRPPIRSLPQGC